MAHSPAVEMDVCSATVNYYILGTCTSEGDKRQKVTFQFLHFFSFCTHWARVRVYKSCIHILLCTLSYCIYCAAARPELHQYINILCAPARFIMMVHKRTSQGSAR